MVGSGEATVIGDERWRDFTLTSASSQQEANAQLRGNGIAMIEGVLTAGEIVEIKLALDEVIENDRKRGVRLHGFAVDRDELNMRVLMLPGKHPKFRELVEHPVVLSFVREMCGERMQLTSFTANITFPGASKMVMHCDQGYMPSPWPPFPIGVNVAMALDDFTIENGGTLFVPGSHRELHGPEPYADYPNAIPVVCPAGSMFAFEDRLWHQTGANVTTNVSRVGLFAHFTRSYLTQQENWRDYVTPELKKQLSPSLRQILGVDVHPSREIHEVHRGV